VEADGVLAAWQQTLPPLGLELNMQKKTVWGPGLIHATSPPAAVARLRLEEGTEGLRLPIHYPSTPLR